MVNNQRQSVINMVHRIKQKSWIFRFFWDEHVKSFNIQTSTHNPISEGATALKLENEVHVNNEIGLGANQYSENINETTAHVTTETPQESLINDEASDTEKQEMPASEPSNGLENFGLQEEGSLTFDNKEAQDTLTEEKRS